MNIRFNACPLCAVCALYVLVYHMYAVVHVYVEFAYYDVHVHVCILFDMLKSS